MDGFKLCDNGHYYPANLAACPYCPPVTNIHQAMNDDKTIIVPPDENGGNNDLGKTQIYAPPTPQTDTSKTQIYTPTNKTFVHQQQAQPVVKNSRKLVGWLVSFTIDANGVDFKLFEGRNTIGSDTSCDIVVVDQRVSSKHLTILFRADGFKFKDELSTNGTYINGQMVDEGNLADGDTLKLGDTVFKFRAVL